jgi:CBS domain-containing protein
MQVRDVMTKDPSCVTAAATIREAAQVMQRENVGIIPVIE